MTTPPLRVIKQLGVVGAGQMGSSIALLAAMHEMQVCVTDVSTMALGKGTDAMASSLKRLIKSGKAPPDSLDATLARIRTSTTMQDLDAVDLVIEAASEREDMKHGIFAALDQVTPSHAILASNTSSLSITRLAAATHRPDKVVGIHFMNPPVLMGLVELVRGLATSQETFDAAAHFAHAMGKTTCVSQDRPGFIVNRILMPMINEAFYALMEGVATREDIDAGMKLGTNQPMGPLTLADFIGLDTCLAIMRVLHDGLGDSKYRPCPLLVQYVDAGWFGRKVGRGVYAYEGR